jgi:hypothetical protein
MNNVELVTMNLPVDSDEKSVKKGRKGGEGTYG